MFVLSCVSLKCFIVFLLFAAGGRLSWVEQLDRSNKLAVCSVEEIGALVETTGWSLHGLDNVTAFMKGFHKRLDVVTSVSRPTACSLRLFL